MGRSEGQDRHDEAEGEEQVVQSGEHARQVPFEGTELEGQRSTHEPSEANVGGGHLVQVVAVPTHEAQDESHPSH